MKLYKILILTIFFTLTTSCDNDDEKMSLGIYENGFFITNEGPFNNGTGTLTFISNDFKTVEQEIYKNVNNEPLGNIVQSMTIHQDKAYIVVNNSHKIVVANRNSMKKITTIEGNFIKNPRYFVAKNNIGYISNWGNASNPNDDFIAVVNLTNFELITIIYVEEGPENLLLKDNYLYANLQGAWGFNNKVAIIDTNNNQILSTLTVGDVPTSILKDNTNNIWVLCSGKPNYANIETQGKLIKITNNNIVQTLEFNTNQHPKHLTINNDLLYYNLNGKVYSQQKTSTSLSMTEEQNLDGQYYRMKINNNKLYTLDALNYVSEGILKIYNLNNNTLEKQITVGIIPGNLEF